jgi:hypothetical protein
MERATRVHTEVGENLFSNRPSILLKILHHSNVMFSQVYDAGDVVVGFSDARLRVFNTALLLRLPRQSLVDQTENIFRSRGLKPAFYVIEEEDNRNVHEYLIDRGYHPEWTDNWMSAKPEEITPVPTGSIIKTVQDDDDREVFLQTLARSRQTRAGIDNPYGPYSVAELGAVKRYTREITKRHGEDRGFIVFKEVVEGGRKRLKPVSVAMVTNLGASVYISNVGTLPSERHNGYGLASTARAAAEFSSEISHVASLVDIEPLVYLATEQDQGPAILFESMGFEKGIRAIGYIKD